MKLSIAVFGSALALAATPISAATIVSNVTIDLTTLNLSQSNLSLGGALSSNVTLSEGDTLELVVDFLGNQTLKANSLNSLMAALIGEVNNDAHQYTSSATLSFFDPTGPLSSSIADVESTGSVHFGNNFSNAQLSTGTGAVSFSGFRLLATVVDYDDNVSHTYRDPWLSISGSGFSIGAVPEPSTWAMMLLGFGAVGWSLRQRSGRPAEQLA